MKPVSLDECFETCLQRIQRGAGVDEALADFPEQASELRSLVEAAVEMRRFGAGVNIPREAQNRSRALFLAAVAAQAPTRSKPRFSFSFLRFATASLIVLAILAGVLLGTNWVSAQALPGDMLYPVKRFVEQIQFSTVQDGPARLELEERLDSRRLDEVVQLNRVQRRQAVSFGGLLVLNERGDWQVGGVTLLFPPAYPPPDILMGTFVQVNGYSDEDAVEVESLSPRQYQWNGVIQALDAGAWLVSGTQITLDQNTQISGSAPQVGAPVLVTAIRRADALFLAIQLKVGAAPEPAKGSTRPASLTPQNRSTPTGPGTEKPENSATPGPRPSPVGAASSTPVMKTTAQSSPTGGGELQKTSTPTVQPRATTTGEASAIVKPSPTIVPSPTLSSSGDAEEKPSH